MVSTWRRRDDFVEMLWSARGGGVMILWKCCEDAAMRMLRDYGFFVNVIELLHSRYGFYVFAVTWIVTAK